MTSTPSRWSTTFDRWTTWVLAADGPGSGDEREQLRWHESATIATSVQAVLLTWALAIMMWVAPREATPYLVVAFWCFALPFIPARIYRSRRAVAVRSPPPATVARRLVVLTTWLPLLLISTGFVRSLDAPAGSSALDVNPWAVAGVVVLVVVGEVGALVLSPVLAASRRRRADDGPREARVDARRRGR